MNSSSAQTAPQPLPRQYIAYCSTLGLPGVHVAAVVHIFYSDLIDEIRNTLKHIVEPFDMIVTTPHAHDVPEIISTFSPLAAGMAVLISENRGRDVGPFIGVHRTHMLDAYDAVLKLHSKKSLYETGRGTQWRQELFQRLCGNSKITRRSISLLRDGVAGMVGADGYHITNPRRWGGNRANVHRLLQSLCTEKSLQEETLGLSFFAGSMFWFAPKALASLHDIPETLLQFEPENDQLDGTLAHALERAFGILPSLRGHHLVSLASGGQGYDVIRHEATEDINPPG